jgi:hypothetical protein
MKTNRLLKAQTGMFPSGFRHEPQRWGGARIRRRGGDKSTIKALPAQLMATQQFDCGRWKLRLERVPVDPDNETTMGMDFDSAAQARISETNEAHWSLLTIERGRRER